MVVTASGELSFKCQLAWVKLRLGMGPFQTKMMVSSLCEDTPGVVKYISLNAKPWLRKQEYSNPCLIAQLRVIDNNAVGLWEEITDQNKLSSW